MNEIKKFGAFSSSVDPSALSRTVSGAIIGAGTTIIFVAHLFGVELVTAQITTLATQIGYAVSGLVVAYGLMQKVAVFLITKYHLKQ